MTQDFETWRTAAGFGGVPLRLLFNISEGVLFRVPVGGGANPYLQALSEALTKSPLRPVDMRTILDVVVAVARSA
jgi:hypothetical protein